MVGQQAVTLWLRQVGSIPTSSTSFRILAAMSNDTLVRIQLHASCVDRSAVEQRLEQPSKKVSCCFFVPGLCNGSTTDFDSVSLGSIPSPGAI